ncbi:hypothetical protein ABB37_06920 [Leptomonas pyrrhocoris]|uniref:Uncharacterized protein n=1 Tax=Leptomonas pyrrhocoris TaxID=157538 RepID=A0A0M9FWQ7_LEPPY|nr:hypothetical protein ABB37_06920 [Leptomonas pyrrhocoris]KPA77543.1 hypothetical protein ABB37_06920 [Leptomonas pyrrhocoris]|eukprot:XP_015655982.1 hypothetical protein ABB37_06920 [Leptomonas pyrrhocoris]
MSSAITLVGNQQVIALTTRLIIGIRLQGTIGYIDPRSPCIIKPRPYLAYFAETLRRLHCDVTLFVPTNEEHDRAMMNCFHERDFPTPFHYIHDHSKFVGVGAGRGNRKKGIAPNNYTEYLRIKANAVNATGQATDRILFIDSEVNYRFTPVQTLVLDSYEPLTRRQQRELMKAQHGNPFGDVSSQRARRIAAAAAKATGNTVRHRAVVHAQHLQEALDKNQSSTEMLRLEQAGVPLVDPQDDTDTLAARGKRPRTPLRPGGTQTADRSGRDPRGRIAGADVQDSSSSTTATDSEASAETSMSRALAINLEDYSLVALSEMIAEMAASDVSVAEYLRMEPLIEKVEVPFHGKANYLPPENCDNIDLLNWDEIKVMEKKARDTGEPETVEETAAHKDFFQ